MEDKSGPLVGVNVYTVGHGCMRWEEFVSILMAHGVSRVVDVRAFPGSRRSPHFSREKMEIALGEQGISYRWEGKDLGGFRDSKGSSRHVALRHESLKGYAEHMETDSFREAILRVLREAKEAKTAIMCAEVNPYRCHRRLVSDYLTAYGHRVWHIVSRSAPRIHRMSSGARLLGGILIYDVIQDPPLSRVQLAPRPGSFEVGDI